MGFAYRDDLEAARLRVADLEREHAALAAHNARLETLAAPAPAPPPVRVHRSRSDLTAGELTVFFGVAFGSIGIFIVAGLPMHAMKPVGDAIMLSTLAAIHVRRWLRKGTSDEHLS